MRVNSNVLFFVFMFIPNKDQWAKSQERAPGEKMGNIVLGIETGGWEGGIKLCCRLITHSKSRVELDKSRRK